VKYEWRPGMKMYEAVWERDGKRVWVWSMHAANEQDVIAFAEAFFLEHPELEFPGRLPGTTVRVQPVDLSNLPNHNGDRPDA
jgi:hypothetical protein